MLTTCQRKRADKRTFRSHSNENFCSPNSQFYVQYHASCCSLLTYLHKGGVFVYDSKNGQQNFSHKTENSFKESGPNFFPPSSFMPNNLKRLHQNIKNKNTVPSTPKFSGKLASILIRIQIIFVCAGTLMMTMSKKCGRQSSHFKDENCFLFHLLPK